MTNPYRWGDVPPTVVAELKSRRKSHPASAVPPPHLVVETSIVFREWAGILNLSAGQVPDRFGTVRRTGHGLAAQ